MEIEVLAQAAIVIVAKAPRPGQVKTRLCPPLNYEQAAALYTAFLLDTLEIARTVPHSDLKIVCPTESDALELADLLPVRVGYLVQKEAGLTAALTGSFESFLAAGYQKVICISSDNPTLPASYLEQALHELDSSQVVLGPTDDGGYYLVGAKQTYPQLFENMIWSTSEVLADTLNRVRQMELTVELLPAWYDLDMAADVARLIKNLPETSLPSGFIEARHTRLALAGLPLETLFTGL